MAQRPFRLGVGRLLGVAAGLLLQLVLLLQLLLQQEQQQAAAQVLGIDLGSEFIKAAVVAPGRRMELLLSSSSSRKFVNAVSFVEKETTALAEAAINQSHKNPKLVVVAASLFLGLAADDVRGSSSSSSPAAAAAAAAAADAESDSDSGSAAAAGSAAADPAAAADAEAEA
ncbi:hypothetical protein EBH_0012740 [Eimeria brunetti]|uniref:DnaK family domain containing protein n=1 Tax=Eimeria brunetti TaxID=51314 RepID=U6LDE3_9EIME|nr:hypothetical protein EBH_0012740 [Eimeria brunetti]